MILVHKKLYDVFSSLGFGIGLTFILIITMRKLFLFNNIGKATVSGWVRKGFKGPVWNMGKSYITT